MEWLHSDLTFFLLLTRLRPDSLELLGLPGQRRHLGVVQGALLIDAVDAKVDGSAKDAVKVAGVVTHWTVAGRIWNTNHI